MTGVLRDSSAMPRVSELPVEHLFDMHVDLEPAQLIPTAVGTRMTYVVTGAQIAGPKLTGKLLPGGGDWVCVGTDAVGRADIRATIRTSDGVLIHHHALGIASVPAESLARLGAGEALRFADAYVRMTPRFETSDERYAWLSSAVCVSYAALGPNYIDYRIYKVL